MKRLGLAFGLLLLLLLGGLTIGPRLMDWEPWRERLAEIASRSLGRPVTLDGPVEVTLLPSPVVRAGGVTIAEPPETEDTAAFRVTARMLRVRLDLGALLAGRLEPRELALVGADVTLPWPPGPVLAFRPPSWITELDAELEDARVRLGDAVLDGVTAHLSSGGPTQALEISGSFAWAGRPARFAATLGRPGWDGIAPLEISLAMPEATGRARGVLVPDGGFEGTMEVSGPDLAALLPSPPGAFRAAGRLSATADLLAADDLAIDLAGAPARGAAALRLVPAPRLDVALLASRLDLDGWVKALRQAGPRPWPVSVDLSAEAAGFAGLTLRRLRGAAFLEEGRLTLTDVSVLLPGETELDFAGVTAGGRLEIAARFAGPDIRSTLAALNLPVGDLDPTLLRKGEGRLRLVLEESQAAVPELAANFEDLRLSGAGTLRYAPRPALGLGLTVDRLDLNRWLPHGIDLEQLGRSLGALDLNLRLAAETARWGEAVLERGALDAAVENGRLTLRRLSGRMAEADIVASGTAQLGRQLRLQDLTLEANGATARGLFDLLPGSWPDLRPLAAKPVSLRLSGGGPAEALALKGEAELGELRLEASGTMDLNAGRGTAAATLRHPGAPRLLAEAFGVDVAPWMGEGSFSLVANLAAGPNLLSAESFELVAGGLRAGGQLALGIAPRPRIAGRIVAERLPLPLPGLRSAEPLPLDALNGFDAEIALEAARVEAGGTVLEAATGTLRLAEGRLVLGGVTGKLAGGALEGGLSVDVSGAGPPRMTLEMKLAGATLAAPLFGLPFDLTAGRGDVAARLAATGHAPAALLATLSGSWQASLRDGVLTGVDLAAAVAATALPELTEAQEAARRALGAGATAFDRLELQGSVEAGRVTIEAGRITTESGATATLSGGADLARGVLDLRLGVRPAAAEAPDLGLRATGAATAPNVLPEIADWARWRAEQG
ncbi:AsmA family protein [Roseomonas sp. AR75]|uniref:AsmA family protein n=1 Tax=Roseomonas sp. AR75 TaxID=2562311 RepID=UPI0014850457|nr:AsmA family protein [Roseomonas sp. AR75]